MCANINPQNFKKLTNELLLFNEDDQQYSSIFKKSPLIMLLINPTNGDIIDANPTACKFYGYTLSQFLHKKISDINILTAEEISSEMHKANLEERHYFVFQHRLANGDIRDVEVYSSPVFINNSRLLYSIIHDISLKKRAEQELQDSKNLNEAILSSISAHIVVLDKKGYITSVNDAWIRFGLQNNLPPQSLHKICIGANYLSVCMQAYKEEKDLVSLQVFKGITSVINGERTKFILEYPCNSSTEERWFLLYVTAFLSEEGGAVVSHVDITDRKLMETQLLDSRQQLQDIIEFLPDATFAIDLEGRVMVWNQSMEELTGISKDEILGKGDLEYSKAIYKEKRPLLLNLLNGHALENKYGYDYVIKKDNSLFIETYSPYVYKGNGAYLWAVASPLYDSKGNVIGAIESIRDITDKKTAEKELEFLSYFDPLTKLNNRNYFEKQLRKLEHEKVSNVGIMVFDVDGLKTANDKYGHYAGDTILMNTAQMIKDSIPNDAILTRIGGDEFAVLLTDTSLNTMQLIYTVIKDKASSSSIASLNTSFDISIGFAIGEGHEENIYEVLKKADDIMYREKLLSKTSTRSSVVDALMKALEARDHLTEGHAYRLQEWILRLAKKAGLPSIKDIDLILFAHFHDLGKIGVSDAILFKPGPLTLEEQEEMKKHSEIGYNIAQTIPELKPISQLIIRHHEWWNGQGYPFGLKGTSIPVECRILSIVDAFDAMTSNRPYRKALPKAVAIAELKEFSGKQFDPQLVELFMEILEEA